MDLNCLECYAVIANNGELMSMLTILAKKGTTRDDILTYLSNKLYNHNNRKFTLIYGTRFSKVMRMSNTIHTLCVEPSESFANDSEIL